MDICSNCLVMAHKLFSNTFTIAVATQHRNIVAPCAGLEGLNDFKKFTEYATGTIDKGKITWTHAPQLGDLEFCV